jgi:hypothetical protein
MHVNEESECFKMLNFMKFMDYFSFCLSVNFRFLLFLDALYWLCQQEELIVDGKPQNTHISI